MKTINKINNKINVAVDKFDRFLAKLDEILL
jgi:hypothetical protein